MNNERLTSTNNAWSPGRAVDPIMPNMDTRCVNRTTRYVTLGVGVYSGGWFVCELHASMLHEYNSRLEQPLRFKERGPLPTGDIVFHTEEAHRTNRHRCGFDLRQHEYILKAVRGWYPLAITHDATDQVWRGDARAHDEPRVFAPVRKRAPWPIVRMLDDGRWEWSVMHGYSTDAWRPAYNQQHAMAMALLAVDEGLR